MAPIQPEWVFEIIESFFLCLVSAVGQPAPRLKKYRWSKKTISVPPVARTSRGAAEAEDTFVITVDPAALLDRLKSLLLGLGRFRAEPRLDRRVLREDVGLVGNEVLDDFSYWRAGKSSPGSPCPR